MLSAEELEQALRVLKFNRDEKAYAVKLRTRVTDRQLARQMGTPIAEHKKKFAKARRSAARKVLYRYKKGSKVDPTKFEALAAFTQLSGKLSAAFLKAVPTRTITALQEAVIDRFLREVFMSEAWAKTLTWSLRKEGVKSRARRIRARHQERYTGGELKRIKWEEVGEGVLNDTRKGSTLWEHWRKVIQRNGNDKEKKSLLTMLGKEMELLYGRYRRTLERMGGKVGTFAIYGGEKRHARQVAEHCLMRDVHPVDLLKYWDQRVENFTDLRYPTLAFLKGAVAIEALTNIRATGNGKPKDGNSHSATNGLDPHFRRRLEAQGFRTQKYADRMLLTIQFMAVQKAKGKSFFIDDTNMRNIIDWSAKEIFAS